MLISVLYLFGVSFYVFAAIGPSVWLAGSSIWVLVERLVARRRMQAMPMSDRGTRVSPTETESTGTIFSCIGIGIPLLAFFLGAWQYQRGGWVFAEQILAAATVCCAIIWLRLRRRGMPNAEVYAMAVWILTCVGWSVMIALDGPTSYGTRWTLGGGSIDSDYGIHNLFGGKILTLISAAWAVAAVSAALICAGLRRPPIKPFYLISLAIPYLCVFWFTEAMGWFHMALAIATIGFAISREVRRIEDDRIRRGGSQKSGTGVRIRLRGLTAVLTEQAAPLSCAAVLVTVLTIAIGIACSLASSIEIGYRFAILGFTLLSTASLQFWMLNRIHRRRAVWKWVALHLVSSMAVATVTYALAAMRPGFMELQVVATGGIAAVALVVLTLRGNDGRYGAMLLGSVFMLLLVYTFDTQGTGSVGPPWTFVQFAGTSVAAVVTLTVMWSVYGPGSLTESSVCTKRTPVAVGGIH